MKKIILLLFLTPLLMATQCEDDGEPTIFRNNYKVSITNQSSFNVGDTIWIEGRVSSKVYNTEIGDSTFVDSAGGLQISLYKFTTSTSNFNAKDAVDKFNLIYPQDLIDFLGICNNSTFTITPTLNSTGNLYKFKLGLKAEETGDFIIKFPYKQGIENSERNLNIINDYPSQNNYLIGFNSCGNLSWALETDIGDFCFKVN